jgi:membrane protein DedA with SNARE-associated domain
VVAGVLSAEGNLHPPTALAACLIGALLGDCVMYAIGYRWGDSLLSVHPLLAKLLKAKQEMRFEEAVEHHAFKVMLLSRFLVGVRGPVYLAAGAVRMPFRKFLLIDMFCASLVVVTCFWLAYTFGADVMDWIRDAELTATIAVLFVVILIGMYFYRRSRRKIAEIDIDQQGSSKN